MILFNSNFDYEIEDYIKDNDGRFLICILNVNNEKILLANYYGLNSDERTGSYKGQNRPHLRCR